MAFSLPIPPDTAIITDDAGITGAALLDPTTGTFLGFVPLADFATASESGAVMLDGTIATPDNGPGAVDDGQGIIGIYDGELSLIVNTAVGTPGDSFPTGVTTDRLLYFYIVSKDGATNLTAYKLNKAGTVIDSWDLATALARNPLPCAVDRTNTYLYFLSDTGGTIKRLDLATDAITTVASLTLVAWLGVGADGNIYVNQELGGVATIEKYDTSFTLLDSVAGGPATYAVDICHFSADDLHLFTWTQKSSGGSNPNKLSAFRKIRLSDFAVISDVTDVPTESVSTDITEGAEISNCCPLLITGTPTNIVSYKSIIWPVWLNDGTWLIFTGTYLGNGTTQRYDLDGNLIKEFTYNHSDFLTGMYNQTALLDENSCLAATKGILWLAGHHSPPAGVIQPGIQAIDLETGSLFPIVNVVAGGLPEVDISAGLTTFEYSSSNGEPTDQGLPPKPTVSCGPLSNLKTPTPNRGCNTCGIGSTPTYTGPSGVVPTADDPIGEATLTGKRDIVIWIQIVHTQYNDDDTETVETLRYAFVEPPVAPRREGRLAQAGTLEQASSDGQGQMKSTSADVVIFDVPGRPIATRRADRTRMNFNRDEMTVYAISEAELIAGGIPKMLGRVLLYGDSSGTPLTASLHGVDHLFIEGGSFSPDKTMPMFRYPRGYYTNAPTDIENFYMPVIYGEVTDHGAVDPATGVVNECGKCTPRLVDPTSTLFGEVYGRFNNNLFASYSIDDVFGSDCGGLGCWGMVAFSDGKGPQSTIGLGGRGDFTKIPGGGWAQLILWSQALGRTEHRILKVNIAARSVKVEGQLDPKIINGPVDWMIERIDHAPRRVKIDIADRQGFDVMIPGYAGYTRSTTYEDFTDPTDNRKWRVTDFGIRGPLLQEHLGGGPTIATNTIGIEDQGDGSGLPIVDGFTAYNHWWDNCVHQQRTTPPVNDNLWAQTQADLPQWSDGLTKTMQSSFVVCQALTARSLGGYGLRIGMYFDEGMSLRDACQLWNDNLGCRTVNEEHGRVKVWTIDKYADTSTWPRLDHAPRVFGSVDTPRAADEAMNVIRCGYDWDPDNRSFRRDNVSVKSAPAIRRNKRYEKPSKHYDFKMLTETAFADWRMNAILGANQDGPIYVPIESCDLGVFDFPIGTGIVFTSVMGPGSQGYIEHPIMLLDRLTDLDQRTVDLQALDVGTDSNKIIAAANRFIATNNDSIAPLASNDAALAPVAVA